MKEILQDQQKTEEFLEKNKALVITVIQKKFPFILRSMDKEDYIQEGMLALYKAMLGYNETKQYSFSTYAYCLIKNNLISQCIQRVENKVKQDLNNNVISLHHEIKDTDRVYLLDILPSKCNIENIVSNKIDHKEKYDLIKNCLTKKSAIVFEMLCKNISRPAIAKQLGCSEQNIEQIVKLIKRRAKKALAA
jgi:RNA polymerase sporulation-specific sigma factor